MTHIQKDHQIEVHNEQCNFANLQEFTTWKIKIQGSRKTGLSCIAHMKVMQDTITGVIMFEYCSTHNSHFVQLAHLPVPSDIKHKIAAKLHDGVSTAKILDDIACPMDRLAVNNCCHNKTS